MCANVFAHYTHCQRTPIRSMHVVTAHCCHSSSTLPSLLLLLPPQSSALPLLPSYLSERSRRLCAGTPRRSAGSRPGHAGSVRGWWWSRGPRWLGYAHPPGPDQWWGSPHWPGPPHWPLHRHFASSLGEGEQGDGMMGGVWSNSGGKMGGGNRREGRKWRIVQGERRENL